MSLALLLLAGALLVWPVDPAPVRRIAQVLSGPPAAHWSFSALRIRDAPVVAASGVAGLLVAGPVVAVCVSAATWVIVRGAAAVRQHRVELHNCDAVAEAVGALAAEVRAGRAPPAALRAAAGSVSGPVATVLRDAAAAAVVGAAPDVVIDESRLATVGGAAARAGLSRLRAAWVVSARCGAGLADVLDRVDADVRSEQRFGRALSAELAGPRASAGLLAALPALGVVLGTSMGADPIHVLLHTVPGQLALLAGVLLDLAGLAWTARIVRSVHARS